MAVLPALLVIYEFDSSRKAKHLSPRRSSIIGLYMTFTSKLRGEFKVNP